MNKKISKTEMSDLTFIIGIVLTNPKIETIRIIKQNLKINSIFLLKIINSLEKDIKNNKFLINRNRKNKLYQFIESYKDLYFTRKN